MLEEEGGEEVLVEGLAADAVNDGVVIGEDDVHGAAALVLDVALSLRPHHDDHPRRASFQLLPLEIMPPANDVCQALLIALASGQGLEDDVVAQVHAGQVQEARRAGVLVQDADPQHGMAGHDDAQRRVQGVDAGWRGHGVDVPARHGDGAVDAQVVAGGGEDFPEVIGKRG